MPRGRARRTTDQVGSTALVGSFGPAGPAAPASSVGTAGFETTAGPAAPAWVRVIQSRAATIVLVGMLVTGLGLVAYPSVADWWNRLHASRVVESYDSIVGALPSAQTVQMLEDARTYNASLYEQADRYTLDEGQWAVYRGLLDVDGTGTMGYVQIPRLALSIPIGHGTSDETLRHEVGHYEGTSLPVGGTGSHAVLIGHRGLPNALLFTHIDQLREGDLFYLNVLGQTLAYAVEASYTVLPDDLSHFALEPDADLCTLVTCTPYGINTHRLLVRGRRVDKGQDARVVADAVLVDHRFVALVLAVGLLGVIGLAALAWHALRRVRQ